MWTYNLLFIATYGLTSHTVQVSIWLYTLFNTCVRPSMAVQPHDSPVSERNAGMELSSLESPFELSVVSMSSTINITEYRPGSAAPLNDSIQFSWQSSMNDNEIANKMTNIWYIQIYNCHKRVAIGPDPEPGHSQEHGATTKLQPSIGHPNNETISRDRYRKPKSCTCITK